MDYPPPPYSSTPEARTPPPPANLNVSRWHPKMSPYRLVVISTTIVLGTLKAVFVSKGLSMVSTTVEWIAGVVITLLFFILDEWESKETYPKHLRSFFAFDCAELMWRALNLLSISRPVYRSDESRGMIRESSSVPITGYRILVSITVVAMGSTKAALAFLGQNTSTNYLDWVLGVLIASVLYYVGLYESNPVNLAPNFFVRDHHTILYRTGNDVLFMLGMAVFLGITIELFKASLFKSKHEIAEFMVIILTEPDLSLSLLFLGIYSLCFWVWAVVFASAGVVAALIFVAWGLREEAQFFHFLFRRGKFIKYYDRFTDGIDKVLGTTASPSPLLRRVWRVMCMILWLGVCLFGIITSISFSLGMFGLMKSIVDGFDLRSGLGNLMTVIGMLLFAGYSAVLALCVASGLIFCLITLPSSTSLLTEFLGSVRIESTV